MTIGSLLLGLALLVGVGLYVSRPIFAGDPHRRRRMSDRKALSLQKEAILTEIQALDFDYETGKVAEEEYRQQREAFVEEAADLLMRIDALDERYLDSDAPALAPDRRPESDIDEIEAAIARRRAKVAPAAAVPTREEAVPVQKAGVAAGPARGNFCPQCGEPADAGDRFCAYCGHQLAEPQHA